ncbi:hypothetical protein [Xanthomonas translucens]|uniref:hypothetical protein n=1 Tax=Xanthomonas campestris pv. translucens TaxID=343 RepID=UPI00071B0FF2|nr:hypothetical protein [Xanthomonas translucens]AVY67189.1 hypothetical protein NZ30_12925 [Xanthomonas translucens pv. undulosa]MCT8281785.1 hypothetical protein [Xanthomonas translucens pv. undulosa]MCT8316461.1 hypothetical protein [Xanthomonas translucens pv. undulosa]QEN93619.1 hypothetical protein F0H33_09730 [Xanthomonas translucens pv. undulosa]QSQ58068.1 hypothetical protein ISN37_09100 [Xanthomonas translucens pv. undulosa]
MELLDRSFQKELLSSLAAIYPENAVTNSLPGYGDGRRLVVNAAYLQEHGLIQARFHQMDGEPMLGQCSITARGMDFLADDGGLGAILGVVTIRLHEETLRHLIESKVLESDLPQTQKDRLIDQLRQLPAETTKHLAMQLVEAGLKSWPAALLLLRNAVGL